MLHNSGNLAEGAKRIVMLSRIVFIITVCMHGVKCWNLDIQGRTHLKVGDTLSLTCDGTGLETPLTNLDWYKESEKITPNERVAITIATKVMESERTVTSTLTVEDVTEADEGKYKCWISNEIEKYINVEVSEDTEKGDESNNFGAALRPAYALFFIAVCILHVMSFVIF